MRVPQRKFRPTQFIAGPRWAVPIFVPVLRVIALWVVVFCAVGVADLCADDEPADEATQAESAEEHPAAETTAKETSETETRAAETGGQKDLDEATRARLSATNFKDLTDVVRLLDAALEKDLDQASTVIAEKMLAGTLLERASTLTGLILNQRVSDRRWPEMRRIAVADLQRAIKLDDKLVQANFLMGQLLLLPGGDRDRAVRALSIVTASNARPAVRAKAFLLRGNHQEDEEQRLADYAQAIAIAPDSLEALRTRAQYYLAKDRHDEALADLDQVLKQKPDDANLHEARGMALFMKRDYDAALTSFDRAAELAPDMPQLYKHRARIYALKNEGKSAIEQLDQGLKRDPSSMEMLLLRAQIRQLTGDAAGAMTDVDQAIQLKPDNLFAQRMRAEILAGSGKMDQAIEDMRRLSRSMPDNIDLLMQLAGLYMEDNQHSRAIKLFDAILATDGNNWQALWNRGDVSLNLGRQREAVSDYELALKLQSDHSGLLNNLAWVLATSPDATLRDGKRAIELATKACDVTEYKRPHILSTLAAAYAETGNFETAIRWSKKAVELGDKLHDEQLGKELKSYQAGKPWRELQVAEEKKEEEEKPISEKSDVPQAPANHANQRE